MTVLLGLVVTCALVLSGCAMPPNPDPGGVYLRQLEHDPVFSRLPSGAKMLEPIAVQPEYLFDEGLLGGGSMWMGGTVTETFTSAMSLEAVTSLVNSRATPTGWVLTSPVGEGVSDWTKHLKTGIPEYLSLTPGVKGPDSYQLLGGVD